MKAVVLAAGEGKRLQPLTSTRSKHMIPLVGKPILEHLLLVLKDNGVKEVLIVTNYHESQIRKYFKDGANLRLRVEYAHQENLLGSGHAISLAEGYVEDEAFLVVYGDLLLAPSIIGSTIQKHEDEGLPVLCVVPVDTPQQYGVVLLKEERVSEIIEKPASTAFGNLANAGVYIFPKNVFNEIKQTPKSLRDEVEITETINGMVRKSVEFVANRIGFEDWMDIGRPWDLLEANKRVLERCNVGIKGRVEDGVHLKGEVHVEEDVQLRSGAYVEGPVFIGRGSDVGPNCYLRPFTSLGQNVRVGNGCEVKNSLILDGTHVAHLSYMGDSIVGANCNFGAGTVFANLRLDKENVRVRIQGERVDSGRKKLGAIIGDDVETGIGVHIMPGVKIGRGSWIGPSTTVYEDIPSEAFIMQEHKYVRGTRRRR